MEFEWDLSREWRICANLGVTFLEAVESFPDPNGFQRGEYHAFDRRVTVLLSWANHDRTGAHHEIHKAGQEDSHHRIGRVAKVSEVVRCDHQDSDG